MPSTWILKLQQVDKPEQPILVHVTQKLGATYDLDLLATDGEEAYKGKIRQRNLPKLRSANFDGTDEDWSATLHYALISKRDARLSPERAKSLEVDCSVSGRGSKVVLTITLRSRVEDITHRLGTIELPYSENTDDVDLFGWACNIADQRDRVEEQVTLKATEAENTETTMISLKNQLADLVQAKKEHEDQLLSKFALLLNEKKLKIRNQQRVLATAKVDPKKLDEVQNAMRGEQKGAETDDHGGKRKYDEVQSQDARDDEESDGFEDMDVDREASRDVAEDEATSGQSDTETATEDEEDLDDPGPTGEFSRQETTAIPLRMSPPPPPRSLPFQKKGPGAVQAHQTVAPKPSITNDDEETASEDDEL